MWYLKELIPLSSMIIFMKVIGFAGFAEHIDNLLRPFVPKSVDNVYITISFQPCFFSNKTFLGKQIDSSEMDSKIIYFLEFVRNNVFFDFVLNQLI